MTTVYFVAGKLGLMLAFVHANATAVWPPTGIALAGLLFLGYRIWPAIFLGAFLVNISTPLAADVTAGHTVGGLPGVVLKNISAAVPFATSFGIAVGNTLEGLLGAEAAATTSVPSWMRPQVLAGAKSEPTDWKSLLAQLHLTALKRSKREEKISLDLLARLAVVKFLRAEMNLQFAQVLERCRILLKSYDDGRPRKALEYREHVASFQVRKKIILRKVGQQNMCQGKVRIGFGGIAPVLQPHLNVQCFHFGQSFLTEGAGFLRFGGHLHSTFLLATEANAEGEQQDCYQSKIAGRDH